MLRKKTNNSNWKRYQLHQGITALRQCSFYQFLSVPPLNEFSKTNHKEISRFNRAREPMEVLRLQSSRRTQTCCRYHTKLFWRRIVFFIFTNFSPDLIFSTAKTTKEWKKNNFKNRPRIVLNLSKTPNLLTTLSLNFYADNNANWNRLYSTYQHSSIQSPPNLFPKFQMLQLIENCTDKIFPST